MAKIFSTEKLSLNDDNVRIQSSSAGAFEITDASDSVLMSRETITNEIGSLNTQDSTNKSTLDSSIASLSTLESGDVVGLNANVVSLSTQDSSNKSTLDSSIASLSTLESGDVANLDADVVSLNLQDSTNKSTLDSSIASLETAIGTNDVEAQSISIAEEATSVTVTYSSSFDTEPAVVGVLRSSDANDPIIGARLDGAPSKTGATFVFTDQIPSANYKIDVLASV